MKTQAAVVIETGQTLSLIGLGSRRWVFPAGGRGQTGAAAGPNQSSERSA